MRQCVLITALLIFLLISKITLAQPSFFGMDNKQSLSAQAPSSQILSPDDFSRQANKLNQQIDQRLSQQLNQQLKPIPVSPQNNTPTATNNDATAATPATPPSDASSAGLPDNTNPTSADSNAMATPPPLVTTPRTVTPPSPSQQGGAYTGFGTGNSGTTGTSNPSSGESGGWNVNY